MVDPALQDDTDDDALGAADRATGQLLPIKQQPRDSGVALMLLIQLNRAGGTSDEKALLGEDDAVVRCRILHSIGLANQVGTLWDAWVLVCCRNVMQCCWDFRPQNGTMKH